MWGLYIQRGEGLAIQSDITSFSEAFRDYSNHDIIISEVKYINYNKDFVPEGNAYSAFFHKRKSFNHEKELRGVIIDLSTEEGAINFSRETSSGIYVPIDINLLIKKVFIAPDSPEWFYDLVKSILDKYEFSFPLVQSDLKKDPVY